MKAIKEFYDNLSPDKKKLVAVGAVVALLAPVLLMFLAGGQSAMQEATVDDKPIVDPLIGTKTNNLNASALNAKIQNLSNETNSTNRLVIERLSRIEAALDVADDRNHQAEYKLKAVIRRATAEIESSKNDVQSLLQTYDQRMTQLKQDVEAKIAAIEAREPKTITIPQNVNSSGATEDVINIDSRVKVNEKPKPGDTTTDVKGDLEHEVNPNSSPAIVEDEWEMFNGTLMNVPDIDTVDSTNGDQIPVAPVIKTYGSPESGEMFTASVEVDEPTPIKEYIPAGSFFKGTLINGMDAPTGSSAQKELTPVLLRIKSEAILPNFHAVDIKECFLIGGGYGSLSSERAFIRAETISCVRNDGGVIEVSLDAYAVGNDGKAGVRGKFVSKQGQYLGNSLKAGALQGMSQAFAPVKTPNVNIAGNGEDVISYTFPEAEGVAAYATANAASATLERLADFYLDMAEGIFPIIEINAGREITFITKRGIELSLK